VLLLDGDGIHLRHGAAPTLPASYNEAIDGIAIGPNVGSCGTAAYCKKPIIVSDIEHDPLWVAYRELARRHGLRACWSTPIFATGGKVLGTFAMYSHEPRQPSRHDWQLIEVATRIASIAIERQRAETALQQQAVELTRSNRELGQFAYVASHDLQEPLRMVASYTQLLARRYKGKLDSNADEFIGYAVGGVNRMQRLLDGLVAYSRVETRGGLLKPTTCQAALDGAISNVQLAVEESDAEVTYDSLPIVMADPVQLTQLFQNLLANAIKFRKKDEPPRIHCSAKRRGEQWMLSVCDNGIGIDRQHAERIFLIFERLHTEAEYPGTGVGLAICKKIVERHGGEIWVESERGQGATFFFTLPASQPHGAFPDGKTS
jgi:light-regulated signal transduction histidine kinase (bacteriophytochrome)